MRRSNICKVFVALFVLGSAFSIPIDTNEFYGEEKNSASVDGNNSTVLGWASLFGGTLEDYVVDSFAYDDGRTVSAGWFQGSLGFPNVIDSLGDEDGGGRDIDVFIVWIDENGSVTSGISAGSSGIDTIDTIALMPNGDLVVAGTYCGETDDADCELALGELDSLTKEDEDDEGDAFVARLGPNATWLWATSIHSPYGFEIIDIMVSSSSEIHLALIFSGEISLNETLFSSFNSPDLLIVTYEENGQYLSHLVAESDGFEKSGGLCYDGAGRMYIAITFIGSVDFGEFRLDALGSTDLAIASFSQAGWDWAISAGGHGDDKAWDCDGKATSGMKVVGEFTGNASFGALYTSQSSGIDFFISEVSSTGGWVDLIHAGGPGLDRATSVIHSKQGSIYITGSSSAGLTLGEDVLQDLDGLDDGSYNDIFLAELLVNNSWGWAVQAGGDRDGYPTALSLGLDGSPLVSFVYSGTFETDSSSTPSQGAYDVGVWLYQTDRDNDGVLDGEDNCPRISNADQSNLDDDLYGDVCDEDDDNDNLLDEDDDCPNGDIGWFSEASTDHDRDGCNDATEDYDDDEDGVLDTNDLCPLGPVGWISTPELDAERDGCADIDTDGDGWVDQMDNCPDAENIDQLDLDVDAIGDICDLDEDGDGIAIPMDNCPQDFPLWISTTINDYDQDGCHDSLTDFDDDEDGIGDAEDSCPRGEILWSSNISTDYDGDGCQDITEDEDDDRDDVPDSIDNCQTGLRGVAAPGQDYDGDGCIDSVEDIDDDDDGVLDTNDLCPRTILERQVGITGCSQYQLDDDLDGIPNAIDLCQNTAPGKNVDLAGCKIISENSVSDDASSNGGLSMTSVLYFFTALLIGAAIFVTFFKNQPASDTASQQPPSRPKNFPGIDTVTSVTSEEE